MDAKRMLLIPALAGAFLASCRDEAKAPGPAMTKVETKAEGLPAAPAGSAQAPSKVLPSSPHGDMPADDVHRGMMGGQEMMPGHPVVEVGETDGNPLPLKEAGLGSAEERSKALARVSGDEAKRRFEEAFRLTFCAEKSRRDVTKARAGFEEVLKGQPGLAEAWRGLAYDALSDNFNVAKAEEYYGKALELRPDYGEVHYALAFLYAGSDKAKGAEHLKKALELHVPDEQGLRRVYGQ